MTPSHSPTKSPVKDTMIEIKMDFPDAMREVIAGKKLTRIAWNNNEIYIHRISGYLEIMRGDTDKFSHQLIVNDGDMLATDWVVVL